MSLDRTADQVAHAANDLSAARASALVF